MTSNDDPATSIPDYQSLMLPVLRVAAAGEISAGDATVTIANDLGLSEAARTALIPSGRQTLLANRVHWAKTYLTKAGLLETTRRGHFRITPRGSEALAGNPSRIDNRVLAQFEEFRTFVSPLREPRARIGPASEPHEPGADTTGTTPDEAMRTSYRRIEAALADELIGRIRAASPAFFERLIVALLLAMGYGGAVADAGIALGGTGDGGVDGVIDQDPLGLDRVSIQAKRYGANNAVGAGAIRDFFGSLDRHRAGKGLFVTTSTFTAAARDTTKMLSKHIVVIDGEQLARLMIRHNVGCRVEEALYLRRIDEDFFESQSA